ncbi:glycosyltransferase [Salinisphaera hydrothermalis]|uniref:Glycosyl transferase group 1 protein n=1 Tax=Salinisphaera hydrothermalis (strain C41B8) TaxID=1304275 RepID=A0A084IP49_SALHC|nr:glycosyltransferase [Salinisphaera hydrothermalis]KEZ78483.1 glycosyl transferase group 1 protein [Salinisphaera hydrothermalis C41B8]
MPPDELPPTHIAFYIPTLAGGGAERVMLRLADEFARRGHRVDLVVNREQGAYAGAISPHLRSVVVLNRQNKWAARLSIARANPGDIGVLLRPVLLAPMPIMGLRYVSSLADYLRRERPALLISALFYANLGAIWARRLAGVETRLIVTQHNSVSQLIADGQARRGEGWRWRHLPALLKRAYMSADRVAAVSDGAADDLARTTGLPRDRVITLYNPSCTPEVLDREGAPPADDWFATGAPPVVLGVGRLEAQKDFTTLIRAFARVRKKRLARLIILGEGGLRHDLEAEAVRSGVAEDVRLPGWVDNPYDYMQYSAVFVLSSAWEGLSTALIEAMGSGCAVVSTDCPSGSREILADGRFGPLAEVGDEAGLSAAIDQMLDAPTPRAELVARARDFSVETSVRRYLSCVAELLAPDSDYETWPDGRLERE